jgi:hypothetical protein
MCSECTTRAINWKHQCGPCGALASGRDAAHGREVSTASPVGSLSKGRPGRTRLPRRTNAWTVVLYVGQRTSVNGSNVRLGSEMQRRQIDCQHQPHIMGRPASTGRRARSAATDSVSRRVSDRHHEPQANANRHGQILGAAASPIRDLEGLRGRPAVRAKIHGPESHRRDLAPTVPAGEFRPAPAGVEPGGRGHLMACREGSILTFTPSALSSAR